ncbi:MAG: nickel pincer cofactor biosynthesis protein LarC [Clostridiales bacterium]|nr:nickel pincer cofactor biosynthesis protein LarC [Clostridiales bacterium]
MRILFLDTTAGASGDMLCGAVIPLLEDPAGFIEKLNSIGLGKVRFSLSEKTTCGIRASKFDVSVDGEREHQGEGHAHSHEHGHEHHHHSLSDVLSVIRSLRLDKEVLENAEEIYRDIAAAEAAAHGTEPSLVHFHELGTYDAIADVTAFCAAIKELSPDRIVSTAVNTGFGSVRCAHGIMPVPAPATAELLKGVPTFSDGREGELCTPTGAALIKRFASSFAVTSRPVMTAEKYACGAGEREIPEHPNVVRAFFGYDEDTGDSVAELVCSIDDMTPEHLAFAAEQLLDAGALDVYTQTAYMKKGRQGSVLTVICADGEAEEFARLIFRYTTTAGIRSRLCPRYTLSRESYTRSTEFGEIRFKRTFGYGVDREKPEYDDVAAAAEKYGLTPAEITKEITGKD